MGNPSNELNHALVTFSVVAPFATGHYVLNQITHTIIYTVKAVVTESTISAIAFFTVVTFCFSNAKAIGADSYFFSTRAAAQYFVPRAFRKAGAEQAKVFHDR